MKQLPYSNSTTVRPTKREDRDEPLELSHSARDGYPDTNSKVNGGTTLLQSDKLHRQDKGRAHKTCLLLRPSHLLPRNP